MKVQPNTIAILGTSHAATETLPRHTWPDQWERSVLGPTVMVNMAKGGASAGQPYLYTLNGETYPVPSVEQQAVSLVGYCKAIGVCPEVVICMPLGNDTLVTSLPPFTWGPFAVHPEITAHQNVLLGKHNNHWPDVATEVAWDVTEPCVDRAYMTVQEGLPDTMFVGITDFRMSKAPLISGLIDGAEFDRRQREFSEALMHCGRVNDFNVIEGHMFIPEPSYYQDDGIHLDRVGQRHFAEFIAGKFLGITEG